MPTVTAAALDDFIQRALQGAGVAADDAATVAGHLVGANLRGHDSHGVMRLTQYIDFLRRGDYHAGADLAVEHQTPAAVACDAGWGLGPVQANRLLDLILPRARSLGVAAGTARNCGHIGRLGAYAERAADEGLVFLATVNNAGAGRRVAPPGGREPRLGTNPLCIGVPTADGPVILDFGTSVVAEGKVRVHHISGTPVPDGWILDPDGRPTNDPSVLYGNPPGSILPMGGAQAYKGFGLALVLDMLVGGLSGGHCPFPGSAAAKGNEVLFLALDPSGFAGPDALLREATELARFVRDCPTAPGASSILLPGDPERRTLADRTANGIPIADAHWSRLVELAASLGVEPPAAA